jgi:hypothetical protein
MNIYLTLDYELFFAQNSGSIEKSIIEPTQKLVEVVDKYDAKLCFFVDCGYIVNLEKYKNDHPTLEKDYDLLIKQLHYLNENGHDLQLHIHPHWEDTIYDGEKWVMDTSRYRLHKFSKDEVLQIVTKYKNALTSIIGDKVFVNRAGGWCIQPFSHIKDALKKNNIWLDSTLYYDAFKDNDTHYMDFRNMPTKSEWKFEDDPLIEDENGYFLEVPISSQKVTPLFYIMYALNKKLKPALHKISGDGKGVGRQRADTIKMFTQSTQGVMSIDGYRASQLESGLKEYIKKDEKHFVIMGHPKALTEYSLGKLDKFLENNHKKHNFTTYAKEFQR